MVNKALTYRGTPLIVPPTADITRNFFGRHKELVQEALFALEDSENEDGDVRWGRRGAPIFTLQIDLADGLATDVVDVEMGERVVWAVHTHHTAKKPDLSPFVRRPEWPKVAKLTIELAGTSDEPWLTRVYAGDYRPPLPWMNSARDADGGRVAALEYWRSHAYIFVNSLMRGRWENEGAQLVRERFRSAALRFVWLWYAL